MNILRAEVFTAGRSIRPDPKIKAEAYLEIAIQLEQLGRFSNLSDKEKTAALRRSEQVFNMAIAKEQEETDNYRLTTND